jgi:phosphatidylserine/phosphatidylglycerophosphate/cardiolipin synthase-like enzyme
MHTYRLLFVAALLVACRGPETAADDGGIDVEPDAAVVVDTAPPHGFCNATDPRTVPVEVVATPEAGEQPYLDALAQADHTIRLQVYLMGYGGILDTLKAKAAAGVDVKVMLDRKKLSTNQKYYDQLVAAGAQVKWSDPKFTYFHAKYFVVDDEVATMSTGNYSKDYSIELERNFVAIDRDPADLADLTALFDADWNNVTPAVDCTRMVVSPVNARERILALIASAQSTLTVHSMQFADRDVRDAVKARVLAGVQTRVMLADPGWIDANADAAVFLKDLGVPVKTMPHLHTKAIVADGARAYVGSENLSWTSLEKNREVGVVVVEPESIAPMVATFEQDWAAGTDL